MTKTEMANNTEQKLLIRCTMIMISFLSEAMLTNDAVTLRGSSNLVNKIKAKATRRSNIVISLKNINKEGEEIYMLSIHISPSDFKISQRRLDPNNQIKRRNI